MRTWLSFSFTNPKHEREVAELIRQKAPGLVISLSAKYNLNLGNTRGYRPLSLMRIYSLL